MVSKTINTNYYKLCMTKLQNIFHVKIIRIFFFCFGRFKRKPWGKIYKILSGRIMRILVGLMLACTWSSILITTPKAQWKDENFSWVLLIFHHFKYSAKNVCDIKLSVI